MKAYIISNNQPVATVETDLPNGETVQYAWDTCEEKLNANRDYNLVNAQYGKIGRAKKYANQETRYFGDEINPTEFLIK